MQYALFALRLLLQSSRGSIYVGFATKDVLFLRPSHSVSTRGIMRVLRMSFTCFSATLCDMLMFMLDFCKLFKVLLSVLFKHLFCLTDT